MCATAGGAGAWVGALDVSAQSCPCRSVLRRLEARWAQPWVDAEREGRGVGPQEPQTPDRGALWAHQRTLHTHQDSPA